METTTTARPEALSISLVKHNKGLSKTAREDHVKREEARQGTLARVSMASAIVDHAYSEAQATGEVRGARRPTLYGPALGPSFPGHPGPPYGHRPPAIRTLPPHVSHTKNALQRKKEAL